MDAAAAWDDVIAHLLKFCMTVRYLPYAATVMTTVCYLPQHAQHGRVCALPLGGKHPAAAAGMWPAAHCLRATGLTWSQSDARAVPPRLGGMFYLHASLPPLLPRPWHAAASPQRGYAAFAHYDTPYFLQ